MDFKKIFSIKQKENLPKTYLAVEIHESLIKSAAWRIDPQNKPEIVTLGSFEMWDSQESLINGIDASLTSAVKDLEEQPNEIIFGLPESWLDGNKIHPSKTVLIKEIIKELALKPLGMVTVTQAIIHHLRNSEGVPPTTILLEIYPTKITTTVVKLGQIKASEEVGRSGDVAKDVEEALVRMNIDQFPSRFLLTNGSNLENEQQQLLSHSWSEKLSFLHLPKVEILPIDFSIQSVAITGGAEAVKSLGIDVDLSKKGTETSSSSHKEKTSKENDDKHNLKGLGFDIEKPSDSTSQSPVTAETREVKTETKDPASKTISPSISQESEKDNVDTKQKTKTSLILEKIKSITGKFTPNINKQKNKFIYPLLFVTAILAIIIGYMFWGKAQIILTLPSQKIETIEEITLSSIVREDTLSIQIKDLSSQTSQSIPTTGEAIVGDKATGKITIYNRTYEPITLTAGTEISLENQNLSFLLNSEVTVASKSSDLVNGEEKFGKSTGVQVTASNIGSEYNITQESDLNVEKYSRTVTYAVAEENFGGGSSRTVKAVSEEDKEDLLASAIEKVQKDLQSQISQQDENLRPIILGEVNIDQEKFDKEVGEEAEDVNLDLTATTQVAIFSRDELINYLNQNLKEDMVEGSTLVSEETNFKFDQPEKISDTEYKSRVSIDGVLATEIDEKDLIDQIVARPINKVQTKLKQTTNFVSATILIKPNIPLLKSFLPAVKKNISLETKTDK